MTRVPIGMKASPIPTATSAINLATCLTWRSSGLGSGLTRCDRAAIRPSSVDIPVAWTTASASPWVHVVPLKSRSWASSSGPWVARGSGVRRTGSDSPFSIEMSISTEPESIRASALTRSPSQTTITSPGTRSRARTSVRTPSRTTWALGGRYADSASTARSACRSCTRANHALIRITTTIATARGPLPVTADIAAATQSSRASGWSICPATWAGQVRAWCLVSSLGPVISSRRAASRSVSPASRVRRSRSRRLRPSCGSTSRPTWGPGSVVCTAIATPRGQVPARAGTPSLPTVGRPRGRGECRWSARAGLFVPSGR